MIWKAIIHFHCTVWCVDMRSLHALPSFEYWSQVRKNEPPKCITHKKSTELIGSLLTCGKGISIISFLSLFNHILYWATIILSSLPFLSSYYIENLRVWICSWNFSVDSANSITCEWFEMTTISHESTVKWLWRMTSSMCYLINASTT